MATINEVYAAVVDAIIVDSGTSRAAALDIIRTFTDGVSNAEAGDWIDAVAGDYFRLALISNDNYAQLRNGISADGATLAKDKFNALIDSINQLAETPVVVRGIELQDLRAERDEIDGSITTVQGFRTGQPLQVIDALNVGINALREQKQRVRDAIERITGDPDS